MPPVSECEFKRNDFRAAKGRVAAQDLMCSREPPCRSIGKGKPVPKCLYFRVAEARLEHTASTNDCVKRSTVSDVLAHDPDSACKDTRTSLCDQWHSDSG
jgi:hypothetical protein